MKDATPTTSTPRDEQNFDQLLELLDDSTLDLDDLVIDKSLVRSGDDLDTQERLLKMQDASYKVRTLIGSWDKEQNAERKLRASYAFGLLIMLFLELIVVAVAFFLIGFGKMVVAEWMASLFIVGVFTKVAGMTYVIIRYLFPTSSTKLLDLIEKL